MRGAVDAARDAAAAVNATMVLATGAQPRSALRGGGRGSRSRVVVARLRHSELALLLEAAAIVPAMNDPGTAPSVALRRESAARAGRRSSGTTRAAAGRRRVHLDPHERAGRSRRGACDPRASGSRQRARRVTRQAVVFVRHLVLAGDVLAALGRAVRAAAAAARCLDRAGPRNRRQQSACGRSGNPRLARAPSRRSGRRRGRRPHGTCRDRAARTTHVPRPERRPARQDARRAGRARRRRGSACAARLRSRERIADRRRASLRPRPTADRTGTSCRRARGLPGRRRTPDARADHLPGLPPLAIGGRARSARARRSRVGGTSGRRGA